MQQLFHRHDLHHSRIFDIAWPRTALHAPKIRLCLICIAISAHVGYNVCCRFARHLRHQAFGAQSVRGIDGIAPLLRRHDTGSLLRAQAVQDIGSLDGFPRTLLMLLPLAHLRRRLVPAGVPREILQRDAPASLIDGCLLQPLFLQSLYTVVDLMSDCPVRLGTRGVKKCVNLLAQNSPCYEATPAAVHSPMPPSLQRPGSIAWPDPPSSRIHGPRLEVANEFFSPCPRAALILSNSDAKRDLALLPNTLNTHARGASLYTHLSRHRDRC